MQSSETPEVAKDEWNIAEIKCKISNHILYFDVLTILASFAVVAMHVNSAYWSYRDAPSWVLNLIIEKTCVWAVPVFFMLTGATLIDYRKRHSTSEYVKRRVQRTVVPFLIWSFVGLFFSLFYTKSTPLGLSINNYLNLIINTSIPEVNVYWFFVPLFTIYLCIPVISLIPENKRAKGFIWLVVYTLVMDVLSQVLPIVGLEVNSNLYNPMCAGWLIFPLLGYLVAKTDFSLKRRIIIYCAAFCGWLLMFVGTWIKSVQSHALVHSFSSGTGLPSTALAVGVFVFIKNLCEKYSDICMRLRNKIIFLSSTTFGLYLIHRYVLTIIIRWTHIEVTSWWWPVVGIPIIYIVTILIVFLFQRIPLLKRCI